MSDAGNGYQYARALNRQLDPAEEERDFWKVRALREEVERQALTTTNTNLRDLLIIAEGQRDQAKADAEHWKGEWAVAMGQLGGARAEVEAVRKYLLDLLAVVHGDGGHHTEAVGTRQSVVDAELAFYALRQRAEAAEADYKEALESLEKYRIFKNGLLIERNAIRAENDGMHTTNVRIMKELAEARAEREALRKDAARLREAIDIFISFQGSIREPEGQAALSAALAVQPTKYKLPFIAHEECYDYHSCARNQRCMYGKIGATGKWDNCFTAITAALAVQP